MMALKILQEHLTRFAGKLLCNLRGCRFSFLTSRLF
jgi:hypothetical protein